jgi:predicted small secreted protein
MNKLFRVIFVLALAAALLTACATVKGISSPIDVDGTKMQVTSVKLQDSIETGGQVSRPSSADKTLLLVDVSLSQKATLNATVTDKNGNTIKPAMMTTTLSGNKNSAGWVFVVNKGEKSFTLNLPGSQTIVLDSMIK